MSNDSSTALNILDMMREQDEARENLLEGVEVAQSTNTTYYAHKLNPFLGSVVKFDYEGPAGDGPTNIFTDVPCAIKIDRAVITEMKCFEQPEGGYAKAQARIVASGGDVNDREHVEWKWQRQLEGVISLPSAKIGYMDNDDFVPAFEYNKSSLKLMTDRALEVHFKSPFKVPNDACEEMRVAIRDHGFMPVEMTPEQMSTKRKDLWNMQARNSGGNPRQVIIERQEHGLEINEFTLLAPKAPEARSAQAQPEFEDFMRAWLINAHRVSVDIAKGASAREAGRMSTVITGVHNGYPLRATAQSLAWHTPKMGGFDEHRVTFFGPRNNED